MGHGEELRSTSVEHRRRDADDRDGLGIRCQPGKAFQTRSRGAFADDHILLPIPAVECPPQFIKRRRLVV